MEVFLINYINIVKFAKEMKKFIVIPAYNEENTIEKVIDSLFLEGYENIVVVDDGSKDQTYNLAKSKNVIVLRHMLNRGQGAALQTGITYSIIKGAEIIIHFDADGQHDAKEIKNLVMPIEEGITQISLGSRFLSKQTLPFMRKLFLKIGVLVIWIFYGIKLSDSHNGFRAFSRKAAKKVIITTDKMEHASEIIDKIKRNKIKYKEIPVTIRYTKETLKNGRKGQGRFDSIEIVMKMFLKKVGL
jgi:polyprenyl-phospho-N-acetylgalactosaminyl synthase